jgi:hypothetical protein
MTEHVSMEEAVRGLRHQQRVAAEHGEPERAALIHLLIVVEELSESICDLHERVSRIERRLQSASRASV